MASSKTIAGVTAWLGIQSPTEQETVLIELACDDAENTIKRYRQQEDTDEIEPKYQGLAIEMAVYQYEKRGVDGAVSFTENSVTRNYEAGSYPKSMLQRITPKPKKLFTEEEA